MCLGYNKLDLGRPFLVQEDRSVTVVEPGAEWGVERELARLQEEMGRLSRRTPRRITRRRVRVCPPIIISAFKTITRRTKWIG